MTPIRSNPIVIPQAGDSFVRKNVIPIALNFLSSLWAGRVFGELLLIPERVNPWQCQTGVDERVLASIAGVATTLIAGTGVAIGYVQFTRP